MSERSGAYRRSFSGLVGSMLVLVLVVLAWVAFRAVTRDTPEAEVEAVDYEQPAAYARDTADFAVLAPASLPSGWKATSVRFDQGRQQAWHLGVLTSDEKYIGVEQADRSAGDMVEQYVGEEAERVPGDGGTVDVDGTSWEVYRDGGDDDLALVREQPDVVTVVVGAVAESTLTSYAASLR